MQNPCSCHWLELTDFLSTSRSSRKDKEIWGNKLFSCYLGACWGAHAAPIETVAGCPPCAGGSSAFFAGFPFEDGFGSERKIWHRGNPFHLFWLLPYVYFTNKKHWASIYCLYPLWSGTLGFGTMLTLPLSEVIRTNGVAKGGDTMSKPHSQSFSSHFRITQI